MGCLWPVHDCRLRCCPGAFLWRLGPSNGGAFSRSRCIQTAASDPTFGCTGRRRGASLSSLFSAGSTRQRLARQIADHAGRSGIPGTHLPLAFTFENGVPAVPYPRQKIRYRHHGRQEDLPAKLDFHTIGWVQLKLVCGKSHPLANSVGDWKHLKRHQQIMFAVRTEGMERHRLRVAAEVWWFANHWSFCRFYCRTMARTRWRWSWFGTKTPTGPAATCCGNASQRRRSI
ncbi:hypothetical protein EMEDMD4_790332 [Sinorhizobium medicae]|uniref:Uncharacterized protein n=1 Tax=Sinorhizobium medicae TaxID=110321 RepID=A0A508WRN2_9HYPH|nr:hypothetical protein EMEDMD4_1330018 [Sinorhizobium medicae]VTZ65308.1 hypothetical protein EMEDMD4_790332 [Sinorhizobium medicae]